jgi:short subunit dehydrogenase-like uncharacterized protein
MILERPFDLLIFGATGFTGKEVARYVCRQWFNKRIKSFALAGRSRDRLDVVAKEVFSETTRASGTAKRKLSEIGIIIADCNDESTLTSMASVSRIVLNCVGPYRFTGKLVVQACVDAKTHYLDVCGEPQFMEDSHMTFHESAVKNCTVIVHACGFDSIPADLGWLFVCDQFQRIHQCSCRTVEEAFQVQTGSKGAVGHYATLQSAVEGISDQETLMKIRKQLNEKYPVTYHFKKPISTKASGALGRWCFLARTRVWSVSLNASYSTSSLLRQLIFLRTTMASYPGTPRILWCRPFCTLC